MIYMWDGFLCGGNVTRVPEFKRRMNKFYRIQMHESRKKAAVEIYFYYEIFIT